MQRRALLSISAAAAVLPWRAFAAAKIRPDELSALIVVDVQNCFVTGGTLPVTKGEEVVPVINKLAKAFDNVVLTQDWHTPGHASFASTYAGKKPFETTKLTYGTQVLWPDHCVQGTQDAALHKDLDVPKAQVIVRKGFHRHVDSYSAFEEADRKTPTGLAGNDNIDGGSQSPRSYAQPRSVTDISRARQGSSEGRWCSCVRTKRCSSSDSRRT